MSYMTCLASRSLCKAVAALAPSSRLQLRAPKSRTSRPLTTAPSSSALNENPRSQSQSTTRTSKRQPRPSRPRPSSAHLSAATHSTSTRRHKTAADHSSFAPRQQLRQQQKKQPFDPSQTSPSSPSSSREKKRPHLQPYELSRRLIAFCEQGNVNLAVTALGRAPRNAQNIKVWNTIIQQCMSAKKYKLAFRVFTDMKRRGFVPNVRTYTTMMSGYATIDDWGPLTAQLELVHSVHEQLMQHLERTRDLIDDPADGSSKAAFILYSVALYISILGKAGKYEKAFDVFHELDTGGALAPDPKIYASLLAVLVERVNAANGDADVIAQSVSEAKYIWRRHMRTLDKQPQHHVQPRSIGAVVKLLSRGEPSDHELMFDILRDFCGLPSPSDGRGPSPPSQKKKGLTTWILNDILDGCLVADRPEIAVHYAQSVMDTRELRPILSTWHLYKLLRAHILLAEKGSAEPSRAENVVTWVERMVAQVPVRESKKTTLDEGMVVLALKLCYRCKDTQSALRIARAMIVNDDSQEVPGSLSMPVKAWDYLFHLAMDAGQDEKIRCLELLKSNGSSIFNVWESSSTAIERLIKKHTHISLARGIVLVLKTVLPSPSDHEGVEKEKTDTADIEAWSDILKRAESFLEKTQGRKS